MMYVITDEDMHKKTDDNGSGLEYNLRVPVKPLEIVSFTCAFGQAFDDWLNARARLKLHRLESNHMWRQIGEQRPVNLFGTLVLAFVIIVRMFTLFPDTFDVPSIFKLYQVLVSLVTGGQIIEVLRFLVLVNRNLGSLVLTTLEMLEDTGTFLCLYSVVLTACTVPFLGLSRMGFYETPPQFAYTFHPRGAISVPLFATYGEVSCGAPAAKKKRSTPRHSRSAPYWCLTPASWTLLLLPLYRASCILALRAVRLSCLSPT